MNPPVQLHIDGNWCNGQSGRFLPILNPATGEPVGDVACADIPDLDRALASAARGFEIWKATPALDRYRLMRKASEILAGRMEEIARALTIENGKPLAQARLEVAMGCDVIDWCSEEARRLYGRLIPARSRGILQMAIKDPVGPVAAFSPWNFPINQAVRKISAALAAGCSIIIKGPEETPASVAALVQAFIDAGIPPGVINLVYGVPVEISDYLIPHPVIRKVSFTGSTAVGKRLAMLASAHMKRITMELGGHAPAIIAEDADIDVAVATLSAQKFRNSGQVCTAPTRFLVQEKVLEKFVDRFAGEAAKLRVGDGIDPETQMGPLAHERRLQAMESFVADAVKRGATVVTGGRRLGNKGFFFAPTVLTDVPRDAAIMNEEPFGPLAPISAYRTLDEAIVEANRLPYGLAAYGYSRSMVTVDEMGSRIEAGVVSINHNGVALPETPFGGIKDSGMGSEGGAEAVEGFLNTKFVTQKAH